MLEFRLLLLGLFLTFIAHRGWYHRRARWAVEDGAVEHEPDRMSAAAGWLALPALAALILYLINPAWMVWSALPFPAWLRWAGLVPAFLGFALLQWSHWALGRNWSDAPRLRADHELVTHGPYRWIRHPIYTAFLFILGAPLLISASWFIGGLWLGMTALDIAGRIRVEEAILRRRFGDRYQVYMDQTGRLVPRLKPSRPAGNDC